MIREGLYVRINKYEWKNVLRYILVNFIYNWLSPAGSAPVFHSKNLHGRNRVKLKNDKGRFIHENKQIWVEKRVTLHIGQLYIYIYIYSIDTVLNETEIKEKYVRNTPELVKQWFGKQRWKLIFCTANIIVTISGSCGNEDLIPLDILRKEADGAYGPVN